MYTLLMNRFGSFALLLCASILFAAGDGARVNIEPRPSPAPRNGRAATIRVGAGLVVVPVTVLDALGAPLRGMGRERFRVFEDGVEQQVSTFSQEELPVSIGIVLDASRSMRPKLAGAREAVTRLFEQAQPGDEYHLVEFNDAPRLLCELTGNTGIVRSALDRVTARGWTALFDGVLLSAQSMRHAQNPRRALLILSDGEDNFSRYDEREVNSYLAEAGIVIYSIGFSSGLFPKHQTRYLRRLSELTGGWSYTISNVDELGDAVRAIGDAIRSQYVLGYSSTNAREDGKYRRIRVQVISDAAEGLSSSWRSGYYAPEGH
jgi:Ca-activated chloride channel family protein